MSDTSSPTIDTYIHELFLPRDDVLEAALQHAHESGLRSIQVPAELGRLLGILARAIGARRILEIGTLGGYSAITGGGRLSRSSSQTRSFYHPVCPI
jgi:predicted O-methyltransferase YrrM